MVANMNFFQLVELHRDHILDNPMYVYREGYVVEVEILSIYQHVQVDCVMKDD